MTTPRLPSKKAPPPDVPTVPIAILLCLVFGGGFFGLLAVIFPGAGMMGVAIVVLGLFFVAQYFVWGRWIYGWAVRKERDAEAAREAAAAGLPKTDPGPKNSISAPDGNDSAAE